MNLSNVPSTVCSPAAIATPVVFGADILSMSVSRVTDYSMTVPSIFHYNGGDVDVRNVSFCNITVTYTHRGVGDHINVETWLPENGWNERLQATGGGGWQAGRFPLSPFFMSGAIGQGYATTTTDAGLGDAVMPNSWALKSPGNVDLYTLDNFGSRSLNDQAIIGKSLIRSYYGRDPVYSYWSGCSQGGRQGLMLAQRYPHAYDGIAASAPAIYWSRLILSPFYALLAMRDMNEYPLACELEFLTSQAVAHCDPKDGVVDGLISDMSSCNYNPFTAVNKTFYCSSTKREMPLTNGAAVVANMTWSDVHSSKGEFLWYGMNYDADITSMGRKDSSTDMMKQASTHPWISLFLHKTPMFNASGITPEELDRLFHLGDQEYTSIIGTSDPDLRAFKEAGGKLITYHGTADGSIPTRGTEHYYRELSKIIPEVQEFYRFFESPGLQHCSGGNGGQPHTTFDSLRKWVEDGTAPDTLPVTLPSKNGTPQNRILCPYPAQAVYQGGDPAAAESFLCV